MMYTSFWILDLGGGGMGVFTVSQFIEPQT